MVCENIHNFMILVLCSEVRKSFITKYVYTQKEFDLVTSFQEETTDSVTYMIVQIFMGIMLDI